MNSERRPLVTSMFPTTSADSKSEMLALGFVAVGVPAVVTPVAGGVEMIGVVGVVAVVLEELDELELLLEELLESLAPAGGIWRAGAVEGGGLAVDGSTRPPTPHGTSFPSG